MIERLSKISASLVCQMIFREHENVFYNEIYDKIDYINKKFNLDINPHNMIKKMVEYNLIYENGKYYDTPFFSTFERKDKLYIGEHYVDISEEIHDLSDRLGMALLEDDLNNLIDGTQTNN